MSDSFQTYGLQLYRLPCPGFLSDLCQLCQWCQPNISSSVSPFSSFPQSFPSGSFPMSWLFTSGGQSIGASSLVISPSNEYSMLISFRIDYFDILTVQGTLKGVLQHHNSKASILWHSAFFMVQLMTIRKPELWLDGPYSLKWCLWFLIHYLAMS